MKTFLTIIFITAFALSCRNDDHLIGTDCLVSDIKQLKKHHCDESANIIQYKFQNSFVFVINPGDCGDDLALDVINDECEVIGYLGGFTGNVEIDGVNFYDNAVPIRTIWKP